MRLIEIKQKTNTATLTTTTTIKTDKIFKKNSLGRRIEKHFHKKGNANKT